MKKDIANGIMNEILETYSSEMEKCDVFTMEDFHALERMRSFMIVISTMNDEIESLKKQNKMLYAKLNKEKKS